MAINGLYSCKLGLNCPEEGFKVLQKALIQDPNDYETNFNLGLHYMDRLPTGGEEMDKADLFQISLKHFKAAEESARGYEDVEDQVRALFNQGKLWEEAGDLEQAKAVYRRILSLEPTDYETMTNLAVLYYKMGDSKEAHRLLEGAHSLNPTARKVSANLIIVKQKEGD